MHWAQNPFDEEVRSLLARRVFVQRYAAIDILFRRCFAQRESLGADFQRLRHLLFQWAYLSKRLGIVARAQGSFHVKLLGEKELKQFRSNMNEVITELIRAFVKSQTPVSCTPWTAMDVPNAFARFRPVDDIRKRWGEQYFDLQVVQAGHRSISTPDKARNAEERAEWVTFWNDAIRYTLGRAEVIDDDDADSYPYEVEAWVLEAAARAISYMTAEEQPQSLWQPILAMARGRYWAERFLAEFHRHALSASEIPPFYLTTMRDIVAHVLDRTEDTNRPIWPLRESVWQAVLGIDGLTRPFWEERHGAVSSGMLDLVERWARLSLVESRHVTAFATWLAGPGARPSRLAGLKSLASASFSSENEQSSDERADDAVASLLGRIWQEHVGELRGDRIAFDAFRRLLGSLADRQNLIALALQGKIAV